MKKHTDMKSESDMCSHFSILVFMHDYDEPHLSLSVLVLLV